MCNGAKEYGSDRSRNMLKNKYSLIKIGVGTEENEPNEVSRTACLTSLPPLLMKDLCRLKEAISNAADEMQVAGRHVLIPLITQKHSNCIHD